MNLSKLTNSIVSGKRFRINPDSFTLIHHDREGLPCYCGLWVESIKTNRAFFVIKG